MADYGKKVSKAGFDVKTTADKNLIFSSKFNSLKISEEKADTIVNLTTGSKQTWTQAHGLGYSPSHLIFGNLLRYGGNTYWVPGIAGGYQLPIYDPNQAVTSGALLGDVSLIEGYSNGTNVITELTNNSGVTRTYKKVTFFLIEDN